MGVQGFYPLFIAFIIPLVLILGSFAVPSIIILGLPALLWYWIIGMLIYLCMMGTAFMGYVLPWGQMSYWGATVITNMFTAFPLVGDWLTTLLWGGFVVDNPTLNRFFSLHYLMPFMIVGVVWGIAAIV